MPLLDFAIDSITLIALVYVAVGLALSLTEKFTMPRPNVSPGQIEIDFTAAAEVEPQPPAVARVEKVWSHSIAPFTRRPTIAPDWTTLSPETLRRECQQRGIKWRNSRLDGKHLRKAEMVAALSPARWTEEARLNHS